MHQRITHSWFVELSRVKPCANEMTDIEIFPSFGYGLEPHVTELDPLHFEITNTKSKVATFHSKDVKLQLDVALQQNEDSQRYPKVKFKKVVKDGIKGEGLVARVEIHEGEAISLVLRFDSDEHVTEHITNGILDSKQHDTQAFWHNFLDHSKYKGRWREVVARSLMILKMMTYGTKPTYLAIATDILEPTGAIVAAPTFSIPEDIGGVRNWDYRYCWVRDSSFSIYILLRMGFKAEAEAYMDFIMERFVHSRGPDGGLPIMFTIHGETDIPEYTLDHLEGYRGSKPVRIGNGAAFHQQFDIYGELMDAIYLYNKYGKPVPWDVWCAVRELLGMNPICFAF